MLNKNSFIGRTLCILGLITFCLSAIAQPPTTASLLKSLKQSAADTNRVLLYKKLVTIYRNEKPDSGIFYAYQGLALATQLNYQSGIAYLHGQIGTIDVNTGKMDSARTHLNIALAIFEKIKDNNGLVISNNTLGICLAKQGLYKEATQHFLAALKINQATNNTHGLVQSYIKLGVLNEQINDLDKALEYFNDALTLNKQLPPSSAASTIFNNLGIISAKKGQMKLALKYFLDALKNGNDRDPEGMALTLLNAGGAYEQLGNIKAAFEYGYRALKITRKYNLPEGESNVLINLASLKSSTKPDTSAILLKQALAITRRLRQHHVRLDVYQGMIDLYKKQGNYKEALNTLEIRNNLKDSLFTLKNAKDIAGLQANNDLANSKVKVQQLKLVNQRSKYQTWIILAIAVCALVVLVIVILFYEKTKKLNRQLLHHQEELENLNNFKDKLFSIIGHDLRSPVATIVNLLDVFEGEEDATDIQAFIPRLKEQSVSTLDVMDKLLLWGKTQLKGISDNKRLFNAKDIIVNSIHLHKETAEQKHIQLIDNTPAEIMIFADYTHVDFIIRNLLANAVKYTHTGGKVEIDAAIGKPEGYNTVVIKDNGIGIAKSLQDRIFEPGNESIAGTGSEKGNSIGLMLCQEFVERNNGKLWVESELEKGTDFYVAFKQ
jgi:signal transduction histidine kinase